MLCLCLFVFSVDSWSIVHSPVFRCSVFNNVGLGKEKKKNGSLVMSDENVILLLPYGHFNRCVSSISNMWLLKQQVWLWIMDLSISSYSFVNFQFMYLKFHNYGHTHLSSWLIYTFIIKNIFIFFNVPCLEVYFVLY